MFAETRRIRRFREQLLSAATGTVDEEKRSYLLFNAHRYLISLAEFDALLPASGTVRVLDVAPSAELTRFITARPGVSYSSVAGAYYFDRPTRPHVAAETVLDIGGVPRAVDAARDVNLERDRLPFADASFDVVLFLEVIEHLVRDPVFALQELARVLKPGGKLLLTTDNANHFIRLLKFLAMRPIYWPYGDTAFGDRHNREFLPYEIDDLLRGIGFAGVRVRTFNWRPYLREQSLSKALGYAVGNALTALPVLRRFQRHILATAERGAIHDYYPPGLFIGSARSAGVWR